jgi:NTF2-related export protein 1/2
MTATQSQVRGRRLIVAALTNKLCFSNLAMTNTQGATGILINVTGTVKYGDHPNKRTFSQIFILAPDEIQAGNYYVQSDNFR